MDMMNIFTRKNFSDKVKLCVIKDAAKCQLCSIPTECGECAHIVASGKNGPRNKHQLVQDGTILENYDVSAKENGLYLCANCHTLIDTYPDKYTYQYLINMKKTNDSMVKIPDSHITNPNLKSCMSGNSQIEQLAEEITKLKNSVKELKNQTHSEQQSNEIDMDISMQYTCSLCHKILSGQTSFKYHVDNKVCQKPNKKLCQHCLRLFATPQMCKYHIDHNVCGWENKNKTDCSSITPKITIRLKTKQQYEHMSEEELIDQLEQTQDKLEQTHDELIKIKEKYKSLKENPQNINNNNNIIVFPSAFGNEDMDLIKNKLGDILGPMIKNHPRKSIPILFNKIHNNDQLPEYHNVYISSERSSYAMVSDGKSFNYKPKKTIIDQIIEDKRSLLNQYIDDNGDQLGEKVLSKYEKYQDEIDDKELEAEIGRLLLNMKSVIANDEKTRKLLEKVNEGQYDFDPN